VVNENLVTTRRASIDMAVTASRRITCARCDEPIILNNVAFLTRTQPGTAFEPWCADCALTLVTWAGLGSAGAALMENFDLDQS